MITQVSGCNQVPKQEIIIMSRISPNNLVHIFSGALCVTVLCQYNEILDLNTILVGCISQDRRWSQRSGSCFIRMFSNRAQRLRMD